MKFVIFACLMIYSHCRIYYYYYYYDFDKFEHTSLINGGEEGIIALNLTKFNQGDTIYLTFRYFNGNYKRELYYALW